MLDWLNWYVPIPEGAPVNCAKTTELAVMLVPVAVAPTLMLPEVTPVTVMVVPETDAVTVPL